jgi:hypothetical protein
VTTTSIATVTADDIDRVSAAFINALKTYAEVFDAVSVEATAALRAGDPTAARAIMAADGKIYENVIAAFETMVTDTARNRSIDALGQILTACSPAAEAMSSLLDVIDGNHWPADDELDLVETYGLKLDPAEWVFSHI